MRRIEAMVAAAEAEHPDEELKQLLRSLVPDFHPHPLQPSHAAQPPIPSDEVRGEISILRA